MRTELVTLSERAHDALAGLRHLAALASKWKVDAMPADAPAPAPASVGAGRIGGSGSVRSLASAGSADSADAQHGAAQHGAGSGGAPTTDAKRRAATAKRDALEPGWRTRAGGSGSGEAAATAAADRLASVSADELAQEDAELMALGIEEGAVQSNVKSATAALGALFHAYQAAAKHAAPPLEMSGTRGSTARTGTQVLSTRPTPPVPAFGSGSAQAYAGAGPSAAPSAARCEQRAASWTAGASSRAPPRSPLARRSMTVATSPRGSLGGGEAGAGRQSPTGRQSPEAGGASLLAQSVFAQAWTPAAGAAAVEEDAEEDADLRAEHKANEVKRIEERVEAERRAALPPRLPSKPPGAKVTRPTAASLAAAAEFNANAYAAPLSPRHRAAPRRPMSGAMGARPASAR